MSKTFDQSKDEVARLCQYFTINRQSFLAHGVKEAHIRQSLIDPFFEALGWDMRNAAMAAPQYREVITEDSLEVEGQQKAPDYTFRVGTLAKFYVEAKKCGVNINIDMGPAYQLRRYGFSARLALSILTDFEELGVYDCASRPRPNDKASHARIQYFGFAEYPDRWREIWNVFSREAVWSGTFDQYAASKRKRGTSEVDSEFLKDIEGWRDVLARNLAIRNNDLSADDLNAAVQKIIDRIIFLRMAEDRGLESYGQLLKLCEQPDIYARFMDKLCQKADQKYNSGLFHFEKEPGVSEAPDSLTPDLAIDDNALKPILQSLYFEHGSPYNFGVMPVEILGTVYERFLGKVIRLTAGHQAKVEEKPEVRKAGGVYYTPAYIVNYIVLNTVGKQIEGKSPVDLAGSKTKPPFRVLDMACGSGSFLLGAYQFLLDHCLQWYQANPAKKHANAVYQNAKGETRLTIAERKRILTTHIFGVDIDRQAVETTKLSLLLKALEGENDTSLSQQMSLFHERALPNLSDNIKCGNSLIASDFSMLPEDLVRVRTFDWPAQFPDAMKVGGFDAIIGNPPYRNLLLGKKQKSEDGDLIEYYQTKLPNAAVYKMNLFGLFMEHSISLLRKGGKFSLIIPNLFFNTHFFRQLRMVMIGAGSFSSVFDLRYRVFDEAETGGNGIFVFEKAVDVPFMEIFTAENHGQFTSPLRYKVQTIALRSDSDLNLLPSSGAAILEKRIRSHPCITIGDACIVYQGIITGDNSSYISETKNGEKWERILKGRDINRYSKEFGGTFVLYDPKKLWSNTNPQMFKVKEKLISRQTSDHLAATYDNEGFFSLDSTHVIHLKRPLFSIKYLLGVFNSRLLNFLYSEKVREVGRAFAQVKVVNLKPLPIRLLNLSNQADRELHDQIVAQVEKMLALTPKLRKATSESEKAALQNAIRTTDTEIDRLVYELYRLTEEEIKIVEGER
jgi:hypothetical protein